MKVPKGSFAAALAGVRVAGKRLGESLAVFRAGFMLLGVVEVVPLESTVLEASDRLKTFSVILPARAAAMPCR